MNYRISFEFDSVSEEVYDVKVTKIVGEYDEPLVNATATVEGSTLVMSVEIMKALGIRSTNEKVVFLIEEGEAHLINPKLLLTSKEGSRISKKIAITLKGSNFAFINKHPKYTAVKLERGRVKLIPDLNFE